MSVKRQHDKGGVNMNNTITIKYVNGSMEINLENWIDSRPTKADMRRVYKLGADSDREFNTNVVDEVQNFVRINSDNNSKSFKTLAEVFGVNLGINAEKPKKAAKKEFVYPEHKHIKYGVYLLAIPAEIYTYKGLKYGIYKATRTGGVGYILVEYSTGAKIDSGNKEYLMQRIIDTYDRAVDGVNRMKIYVDRNTAIRSGQYIDDIGKSLNIVQELFNLNIITKAAYINTVSEFSKLTENEKAA